MSYATRYSIRRFVMTSMIVLAALFTAVLLAPETSRADGFNWNNLVVNGETYSFVSPVKNQGSGGTCWAFDAAAALEARYQITRDDPTFSIDLSEQMLISAPNAGNATQGSASTGGYPDTAMNYLKTGLVTEQTLPYLSLTAPTDYSITQGTVNSWSNQVCKTTSNIAFLTGISTATIKADLKMYGPMSVTMSVPTDWYGGYTASGTGGHAVLITGYQDDASAPGGGYFIVKNSWGTWWTGGTSVAGYTPMAGYGLIAYNRVGTDRNHYLSAITGPAYFTGALSSGTWNGGSGAWSGGGSGWNTSETWSNGESQAVFSNTGGTITVDSYTSTHGLTFNTGATGYCFTDGSLIVTGSGIVAGESATINSALTVGAPQTWAIASDKQLTLSGSLNLNISSLTIAGGGNTVISGPIHDAKTDSLLGGTWTGPVGTLTKTGSGILTLSGTNNYTGTTTVNGGALRVMATGTLGNTTISVSGGATLAPNPGSGTVVAGSTGVGSAAAILKLGLGSVFDMTDGEIGTFNLNQQLSFSGTALTLGGATLKFDLSSSGADRLMVSKGAVMSNTNTISITGIGSNLTPGGTYTLISASSGLNSALVFPDGSTSKALTVGDTPYKLTLTSSGTAETVHVYGPTSYQLAATVANSIIIQGGSATVTSTIQNTGLQTNNVPLDYTAFSVGLAGVGSLSTLSQSGSGLIPTKSDSGTCTFSSNVPGTAILTPTVGSATNNMIGGSASGNTPISATVTVLDHAAPSLAVSSGNNLTVIVGASGITAGLSLSNGTQGQNGLAALDVNSLGTGVIGLLGNKLVASGSSQSYTAALSSGSLGTHTQMFSLNIGDDHTLSGASPATSLSTSATLTVLDHSNASLSPETNLTTQIISFGNFLKGATAPPSQNFAIYNRANTTEASRANLKLTSFTASGDAALTSTLSSFDGLTAGSGTTCTASFDTSNYTTTGTKTLTMSASQLVDDSTLPGAGSNNNGTILVKLQGKVGTATADASNSPTQFGTPLTASVAQNASYANLESKATATTGSGGAGMVGNKATILAGNASVSTTVSMAWRTAATNPRTGVRERFVSDVVDLSGMGIVNGQTRHGSVQTDTFVFQMNYDSLAIEARMGLSEPAAAEAGLIQMNYLDQGLDNIAGTADDQWELAVLGNFGSTKHHFVGVGKYNDDPRNEDLTLGDYGVDVASHSVWAVLDHNSQFAVVPEPSTFALLGVGFIGLAGYGWRRRQKRCLQEDEGSRRGT